jgi:hypothetical protein
MQCSGCSSGPGGGETESREAEVGRPSPRPKAAGAKTRWTRHSRGSQTSSERQAETGPLGGGSSFPEWGEGFGEFALSPWRGGHPMGRGEWRADHSKDARREGLARKECRTRRVGPAHSSTTRARLPLQASGRRRRLFATWQAPAPVLDAPRRFRTPRLRSLPFRAERTARDEGVE